MSFTSGVFRTIGTLYAGMGIAVTTAALCAKESTILMVATNILNELAVSGGIFGSAVNYQTLATFIVQEPVKAAFAIKFSMVYLGAGFFMLGIILCVRRRA